MPDRQCPILYIKVEMKLSTASCLDEPVNFTRDKIPWWLDLDKAARMALSIPTLESDGTLCQEILACTFDVIVIGAGVAGLSATLEAAKLGLKVLCLEAGPVIGLGATGRNAGILCAGINMPIAQAPQDNEAGQLWRQTAITLAEMQAKSQETGSLVRVTQRGGLGLATSKTAVTRLIHEAKARTEAGLKAHMISTADAKKMSGGRLNLKGVQAAICYPDEGSIHPLTLLAQLACDARLAGAKFIGGATVLDAKETSPLQAGRRTGSSAGSRAGSPMGNNPGWQLKLAGGLVQQAPFVIKAVGPTAAPTARIYALSFKIDLPSDFPLFWDAAPYVYYDFRAGDGRLTASGGRYAKVGGGRDAHYHKNMADATRHWMPELARHEPSHTWAVDIEVAHDLVPHLTPLGKQGRGFAIDGLGALGVLPGIVLGRQAAQRLACREQK
jgi:glycine/D-amino acid oxidase-like deaminating enzyme